MAPSTSEPCDDQGTRDEVVRRGMCFEDFRPGQVVRTGGRTVTEADIVAFAGLSGDFNPIHVDEEFARRTPFRGRVAHGMLVQAVATGLADRTGVFEGTVAALEEVVIRFRAPVRAGDTLTLELTVLEKEPTPPARRGRVRFGAQVRNQDGELALEGEWLTVLFREAAARKLERRAGRGREA